MDDSGPWDTVPAFDPPGYWYAQAVFDETISFPPATGFEQNSVLGNSWVSVSGGAGGTEAQAQQH